MSYGQSYIKDSDSVAFEELHTNQLKVKQFDATKKLKKMLERLTDNCRTMTNTSSQEVSYYLLSKKNDKGYQISIAPIIDPTYEQLKKAFGILFVKGYTFYCIGDVPSNLIQPLDEKYYYPRLRHEKADEYGFSSPKANLLFDLNTQYEFHSLFIKKNVYDISIQPCHNTHFHR
ncbi:MAG: hypothetical protein JSS82_13850 [Bacteroidetes bacterium]|nr:hypothetical protein [Bacteroidota bacterium]